MHPCDFKNLLTEVSDSKKKMMTFLIPAAASHKEAICKILFFYHAVARAGAGAGCLS